MWFKFNFQHSKYSAHKINSISPQLKKLLDQRITEEYDLSFETESNIQTRIVKSSDIIEGQIRTTLADHKYYSKYDLPDTIKLTGIYCGSVDEWLPLLLHDGWYWDTKDLWVVEIDAKGHYLLSDVKLKYGGEFAEDTISEGFIVSETALPIVSKRKLSTEEIEDAESEIDDRIHSDFEDEEEEPL